MVWSLDKIKVGVLTGGVSSERYISIKSCENVIKHLDENKYIIKRIEITESNEINWLDEIINSNLDVIFNTLHGGIGENGSIQGLLQSLEIEYVGSKVFSSALCMDKKALKELLSFNHIQVAKDVLIKKSDKFELFLDDIRVMEFPLIVKPNLGGSSIGIEIVENICELENAVYKIREKYYDDTLVEKYIKGKEISCCMMEQDGEVKVLAILEANKKGNIFGYEDKYERGVSSEISLMPDFMKDMIKDIAIKAFKCAKCKDYACIDMIVRDEQIYLLEINTSPGLTKSSLIPMACKSSGIGFSKFLDTIIYEQILRKNSKKSVDISV